MLILWEIPTPTIRYVLIQSKLDFVMLFLTFTLVYQKFEIFAEN